MLWMRAPQFRQRLPAARVDMIRRDLRQRPEYEGVFQLVARNLQVARTFEHQVIEEHDIDVEWPVAIARTSAIATMRVFQCMQPVVQ